MQEAFYEQRLLSVIMPGALDACAEVTNFEDAFNGCTNLTSIPEGLFDKCTKVTDFTGIFSGCTSLAFNNNSMQ